MKSYIEHLAEQMRAKADALRLTRIEHQARSAQEQFDQARPLVERVADAIAKLTPEQIAAGISLDALCAQLKGKYRGNAQPKAVGAALRQLGFHRVRAWRESDAGFRALWHKSATTKE